MEAVATGGWEAGLGDGTPLPGRSRCCPRNMQPKEGLFWQKEGRSAAAEWGEASVQTGRPVKRDRSPAQSGVISQHRRWVSLGLHGAFSHRGQSQKPGTAGSILIPSEKSATGFEGRG